MTSKNILSVFWFLFTTAFFSSSAYAYCFSLQSTTAYKHPNPNNKIFTGSFPNTFTQLNQPSTKIKYSIPSPVGSRHASTKLGNHASTKLGNHASTSSLGNPASTKLGNPASTVQLKVYDVLGNEIATLVNEIKTPGEYEVEFDGSKLSSGVYFYRINAGSFMDSRKMVLTK